MSDSTATATDLTSQYIRQVTEDLERNAKEQQRVTTEIASLQEQLAALQHDHKVLTTMRRALGAPGQDPGTPSASAAPVMPSPREKTAAASGRRRRGKEGVTVPSATVKVRKKSAAGKSPAEAAQPTLVTLVGQHLSAQTEPRSAAEITAALSQGHPDRDIRTTVVRTTLENLVARSKAQRTKQGSSVSTRVPARRSRRRFCRLRRSP
ncbi:hypothetical protein [Streptomyces dangxiongensis]|uniref:hypothetical protein n=1 Tax=Streptomyces dangxiongensis TaxID=1442032 RepID=UPI00196A1948|nr:hypothetical protein [Streptomyces dangxiongensis]